MAPIMHVDFYSAPESDVAQIRQARSLLFCDVSLLDLESSE